LIDELGCVDVGLADAEVLDGADRNGPAARVRRQLREHGAAVRPRTRATSCNAAGTSGTWMHRVQAQHAIEGGRAERQSLRVTARDAGGSRSRETFASDREQDRMTGRRQTPTARAAAASQRPNSRPRKIQDPVVGQRIEQRDRCAEVLNEMHALRDRRLFRGRERLEPFQAAAPDRRAYSFSACRDEWPSADRVTSFATVVQ